VFNIIQILLLSLNIQLLINFLQDALQNSNFETYGSRTRDSLSNWNPDCIGFNLIEAVLCHICRKERPGAVLVFMTGWDDISSLKDQLKAHPLLGDPNRVLLLSCHGSMATSEQVMIINLHFNLRCDCFFMPIVSMNLRYLFYYLVASYIHRFTLGNVHCCAYTIISIASCVHRIICYCSHLNLILCFSAEANI
jgi:hypothetical protein